MSWIQINQQQTVEPAPPPAVVQYRLHVEVTAAYGIDAALFCYATTDDEYSHVAALGDLQTFPSGRATALAENALFYRATKMDKVFTTPAAAAAASAVIQARLRRVNRDWGQSQTAPFGGVETFIYDSETP